MDYGIAPQDVDNELEDLLSSFQRIADSSSNSQPHPITEKRVRSRKTKLVIGISLNCNGLGSDCKKKWICDFIKSKRPVFLGIQESKLEVVHLSLIRSIWPFLNVDYGFCVSSGASGGILTLWNTNVFTKEHQIVDPNYLVTVGSWVGASSKVGLINVYAPQSSSRKEALWVSIEHLVSNSNVIWIIFGDFNVVRSLDERSGSIFNHRETTVFNDFINRLGLFDFPLGGRKFTRFDKGGCKLSKLDRFLVTHNFFREWNGAAVSLLSRTFFDHCPIMLCCGLPNFNPKPFKVFDRWIGNVEMLDVIVKSWSGPPLGPSYLTADLKFKNIIKKLRLDIKAWTISRLVAQDKAKKDLIHSLDDWDHKAELGLITDFDIGKREEWLMDLVALENIEREDLKQKSRVKWAMEVDENTRLFHSIIKHKIAAFSIKGVQVNGVWRDSPNAIMEAAINHFSSRFKEHVIARPRFNCSLFKKISDEGSAKIAKGCNPSFIVLIPKCSDPLTFSNYRPISLIGSKLLLFKVDFEKAFDSVSWPFLHDVMSQMGFGLKWRNWIGDFLSSASISASILDACIKGLFKGVSLADNEVNLSLLQYADDALFFGEWSRSNANNLILILKCFKDALGLKVHLDKSRIFGVGVDINEAEVVASSLGCLPGPSLLNKLSAWKAKSLSIGGRLTLIKYVLGSIPIYYLSLFKAQLKIINLLESLRARFFWGFKDGAREPRAAWQMEMEAFKKKMLYGGKLLKTSMAPMVVLTPPDARLCHGTWCEILKSFDNIKKIDPSFKGSFSLKISNGSNAMFWKDIWRQMGLNWLLEWYVVMEVSPSRRAINDVSSLLSNLSISGEGANSWVWSREASGSHRQHCYAVTHLNGYGVNISKSKNRGLISAFEISSFPQPTQGFRENPLSSARLEKRRKEEEIMKARELEKGYTSRISVAPKRNRILVYPDSDEEDEEYCSLPPLLPYFETPQPCVTFNSVHHNSHNEVDIDNMTLEDYARYKLGM
nr:hypothetical protein [Tanacetum cinerariifolium]